MRRFVYAVIVVLLLSSFAIGRGQGRRSKTPVAQIRIPEVQNFPELLRRVRGHKLKPHPPGAQR